MNKKPGPSHLSEQITPALAWFEVRTHHVILSLLLTASGAQAMANGTAENSQDEQKGPQHLLGDWGGLRKSLSDAGIAVDATYTGESAANISGGKRRGIAYAGELAAKITFDLSKIAGAQGLTAHAALLNRHGESTSKLYVGDQLFHAQEIYGAGGHVPVHLGYLYLEQKLAGGKVDLKGGRLPVMTDFATLSHGCDFLSLTICATRGLVANLGFTSYPRATWGASVTSTMSNALKVRSGVYEVNPKTGGDTGFNWSLHHAQGIMIPVEAELSPTVNGRSGTLRLGLFLDTARFSEWNTAINGEPLYATEAPARKTTREGGYILAQQPITGGTKSGRGLTLLAGYTYNSPSHALFRHFAFAGLLAKGPFSGRPKEEAGVQISYGRVPPALTERQREDVELGLPIANGAPGVQTHEELIEGFYDFSVGRGVDLVPDIQFVHRPSGSSAYPDALVLAFRFKANL